MQCKITYNYIDKTAGLKTKDGLYPAPEYFDKKIEDIVMGRGESDSVTNSLKLI